MGMGIPHSMIYLLKKFAQKHGVLLTATIVSSAITFTIESVWIPRILGNTFGHTEELRKNMYNLVLTWVLMQIGNVTIDYCNAKLDIELNSFLNSTLFHHLFLKYQYDHKYINSASTIDTLTVLHTNMKNILYRVLVSFFPRAITLCFVVINITSINPKMGYLTALLLLSFFIGVVLHYAMKPDMSKSTLNAQSDYIDKITDVLDNMEWVSTIQDGIKKETESCRDVHTNQSREMWKKHSSIIKTQTFIYGVNVVIFTVLLYYIYHIYKNNEITSDQVTKLILAISPLFINIYDILFYIPEFVLYLEIYDYYDPFLQTLFKYDTVPEKNVIFDPSASIHVSNMSFSYDEKQVYDKISLSIPAGSFVTLRGLSGSGKSTFIKLLGGILKPTHGTIMIDGYSIHDVSLHSLYQHMLYLHQHPTLFDQTVYYNISYGLDVPRDTLLVLMEKYNIRSYLPDIDAKVGKGGKYLSGGQRQLIHMIRCMFSSANIFLLDESMSAMDETLSSHMITLLNDLNAKGKTILLISHHETINTSSVIQFDNGVPTWTHKH